MTETALVPHVAPAVTPLEADFLPAAFTFTFPITFWSSAGALTTASAFSSTSLTSSRVDCVPMVHFRGTSLLLRLRQGDSGIMGPIAIIARAVATDTVPQAYGRRAFLFVFPVRARTSS